jgi:hypothetical protein
MPLPPVSTAYLDRLRVAQRDGSDAAHQIGQLIGC